MRAVSDGLKRSPLLWLYSSLCIGCAVALEFMMEMTGLGEPDHDFDRLPGLLTILLACAAVAAVSFRTFRHQASGLRDFQRIAKLEWGRLPFRGNVAGFACMTAALECALCFGAQAGERYFAHDFVGWLVGSLLMFCVSIVAVRAIVWSLPTLARVCSAWLLAIAKPTLSMHVLRPVRRQALAFGDAWPPTLANRPPPALLA